jgi:tRNA U34 5-methylaminomethyl-2-thiouridine-forming methyltransferase MnmC
MKTIKTADGSLTIRSELFGEHFHTLSGAKEESIKKYVEPCEISTRDHVSILDYCFGLGYNAAAAIDLRKKGGTMDIVGIELDPVVLALIPKLDYPFACHAFVTQAVMSGFASQDGVTLRVITDDVRKVMPTLKQTFDVVFFDPFSPKKCPELWTQEVFAQVYDKMKPGGILATYSYARAVRESLKKVGFLVKDGPIVGRRSPSTLAIKPE